MPFGFSVATNKHNEMPKCVVLGPTLGNKSIIVVLNVLHLESSVFQC